MKPETKSIKTFINNMWITTLDPSKPAFPLLIALQNLVKLILAKVRPIGRGDINFSIGNLPQQEIADAHLPTGSDQKVRIRYVSGIKVLSDSIRVNRIRVNLPVF